MISYLFSDFKLVETSPTAAVFFRKPLFSYLRFLNFRRELTNILLITKFYIEKLLGCPPPPHPHP